MDPELESEIADAVGRALELLIGGEPFTAEDIARNILAKEPDVIRLISDKLGYSPEDGLAWLQARIEGILNRVSIASAIALAKASRNNPENN